MSAVALRSPALLLLLAAPALGQRTTRVSVGSAGTQAAGDSRFPSITPDGRFVAFMSDAPDLVPGDTNSTWDVFVHDRQSGTTVRASVGGAGAQGDDRSELPTISADGRFVAFWSAATNLVPGDTNGWPDVFVHDVQTGATARVSVDSAGLQADRDSYDGSISPDGRFVAFESAATNLVPGDTNGAWDIFVHDLATGATARVSLDSAGMQGNSNSYGTSVSSDGRYVAFDSFASNLVPGDTNGTSDLFVRDRWTGATERVSVDSSGSQGNAACHHPAISSDARFVAFRSLASNLVPGDTNGTWDVFVRDRAAGTTRRVSVGSAGLQGNASSERPAISSDGRFVAFLGQASNLVPNDANGVADVFLLDVLSGAAARVSTASNGQEGNGGCILRPSISADGRFVAFASSASNLVPNDTNGRADIFVRDRGPAPILVLCSGDGAAAPCPCGNDGLPGRGCENSSGTGGALLSATGLPALSNDTLVLAATGEKPTALSVFVQGSALQAPPLAFGDGLRCAAGHLVRLYAVRASGGNAAAPQGVDPSISARSAALGDPIPVGATRHYQVHYRDADPTFCPSPAGGTWNSTNALSAAWGS
jgi:Tol biopolymer transport system component